MARIFSTEDTEGTEKGLKVINNLILFFASLGVLCEPPI
jgi:hypothetical protein